MPIESTLLLEFVQLEATTITSPATRLHIRVAWLCGAILLLEGYDIAAVGYAIPSLVDAWKIQPSMFTHAITAGNVGLMIGSLCAGLLGDWVGRKPVLVSCVIAFGVFSLLSALVQSPSQLEVLRFLTGMGLGGGLPIAVALTSEFAPQPSNGQLVIVMLTAVPIGFTAGGLLASSLVGLFGWPGIFVAGGALPLAAVPVLVYALPDSFARFNARRSIMLVASLFQDGLTSRTLLLWVINTFSYLGVYFILSWMPAMLHASGVSSSRAILGTTIYGLGVIATPLFTALAVEHLELEHVLTAGLAFGALCVLSIGILNPAFAFLSLLLCGVGIGGGMSGRNQHPVGPDLSSSNSLDGNRVGARSGSCRHDRRPARRRSLVRTWVSNAKYVPGGCNSPFATTLLMLKLGTFKRRGE